MSDLRNKLVKLAQDNPELRPHLLPLLSEKTAGGQPSREKHDVIKAFLKAELEFDHLEERATSLLWDFYDGGEFPRDVAKAMRYAEETARKAQRASEELRFQIQHDNTKQ